MTGRLLRGTTSHPPEGRTICGEIPGACHHFACGYQLGIAAPRKWSDLATYVTSPEGARTIGAMNRLSIAPPNATHEQMEANRLTNTDLGLRLDRLANLPRSWDRPTRDAILIEAAKRLLWPDNYEKHR